MGMFQNFMLKQMLKSKMKGVPEEQQEKIFSALEKNPKFFEQIAKEIEQGKKQGKSEMTAAMEVMRKHQAEFQKLLQ